MEVFVTGYGEIGPAKLILNTPADAVDTDLSLVWSDLRMEPNGRLIFGTSATRLEPDGFVCELGGMIRDEWPSATFFFDREPRQVDGTDPGAPIILTEARTGGRPLFRVKVVVSRRAKPGSHSATFVLTYFNGEEWRSSVRDIPFQVTNILQRHEGLAWGMALAAAVATIAEAFASILDLWLGK